MRGIDKEASHFDLVTRGHRFVLEVLPFRDPESRAALTGFVNYAAACGLAPPVIDAVLVRCVAILDRHTGGRLPSLVERYLSNGALQGCVQRFSVCVNDLLRYRGIAHPLVASAVAEIDKGYADPQLREILPEKLGVKSRVLCNAFEKTTGLNTAEYVRAVRLSHAARLLVGTRERKIWASVGYNDASNFIHDFQEQFGVTPGEYRKRALPGTLPSQLPDLTSGRACTVASACKPPERPTRVLLVDDDIPSIETIGDFLRRNGYVVTIAATGEEGLREASSITMDVVLLDYWLGDGITGLECLRGLRRQRHTQQPAVAMLTADWDVQNDEVGELGALLVYKMCDLDQIQDTVLYLTS